MKLMPRMLGCVLAVLFGSAAAFAQSAPLQTEKLDNGLEIVGFPTSKVPLVTIVLAVKAGSMTETKDINGLTHLWEHMFFKGNKRLSNQEAFNDRVRELGIVFNGDTSAEKVRYYITLPSVFLDEGIQFMADALSSPLLEQGELERERHVVLNEYDRNASQPRFDLYQLNRAVQFGDLEYRRNPLGIRKVIETATREQLLRIKSEVFVPQNTAILVSGDFRPEQLTASVKKHFGSWEKPANWKPVAIPPFAPMKKTQKFILTNKEVKNISINWDFDGPKAQSNPQDTYAADVLTALLSLRSGKFYKKYVESGLTTNAAFGYYTQSQAGELGLNLETNRENFSKVNKLLQSEIAEWAKPNYFTATQLEDVQRSLDTQHQYEINKPSEFVKTLAFWWAITGLDYYTNYRNNMKKVTLEDVRSFIKKYLVNQPSIQIVFLSPEDAKKLKLKDNSQPTLKKHFAAN